MLTFQRGGSHSLSEIAALSGIPVSTVHRMVADLTDWLFLERDGDGRTYRPGAALRSLAQPDPCSADRNLRDTSAPWLEALSQALKMDVRLGVLSRGAVSYIEKRDNLPVNRFSNTLCAAAHATAAGKVLMAFSSVEDRKNILNGRLVPFTPQTVVDTGQLLWILRNIRIKGFATADGELRLGQLAIAVPVFGPGGKVAAALELDVTDPVLDIDRCLPAMLIAAGTLSRELGLPDRGSCCSSTAHASLNGSWPGPGQGSPTGGWWIADRSG